MESTNSKFILKGCFLLGIGCGFVGAQSSKVQADTITITPESNLNSGLLLTPHDAAWKVDKVHTSGKVELKGVWRDRFEIVDFNGTKAWLMTQYFSDPKGKRVLNNLNYVAYASLLPIRIEQNHNDDTVWVNYNGLEVNGAILQQSKPWRNFTDSLKNQVFDFVFSGLVNFLHMNLREGMVFKIPVWGGTFNGTGKTVWTTYTIMEKTKDYFGPNQLQVWLVQISNGWTLKLIMAPPYVVELSIPKPYGNDRFQLINFNLLK